MESRWDRLGPVLGVVFLVLLVLGFAVGGSEPQAGASAAKVISWYGAHRSRVQAADYLLVLTLVVGLGFYGYLRDRVGEDSPGLAATSFGGAILFAVGGALSAGSQLALADIPSRLGAQGAVALNEIYTFVSRSALGAGSAVLLLACGLAIIRARRLPAWTGWLAVVLGVVSLVPVDGVNPLPAGLWTLIISVVMLRRDARGTATIGTAQQAASAAR